MNLVGFTAHPYQNYPELPLPKDGVLNGKMRFFCIKWGRKIYFSLKMGRSTQKGHLSRYIHILSQYLYGSTTPGANWIYPGLDEEF